MENDTVKLWVRVTKDIARKLDRIAKRESRSRQKQIAFFVTQSVNDSYLAGERKSK